MRTNARLKSSYIHKDKVSDQNAQAMINICQLEKVMKNIRLYLQVALLVLIYNTN